MQRSPAAPAVRPPCADLDEDRGWAVAEIRPDGSLGPATVVRAGAGDEAVRHLEAGPTQPRLVNSSNALDHRLGQLRSNTGHLIEAERLLRRGSRGDEIAQEADCLARLALIEAYRGSLGRAQQHADLALRSPASAGVGADHASLALAWVHLERTEFDAAAQSLEAVTPRADAEQESWLYTAQTIVEAALLVSTHRPVAAVRLLAEAADAITRGGDAWAVDILTVARADALLAADEPQRALSLLTPLAAHGVAEASVITAAARLAIGDLRGAESVLNSVTDALDRAPLGVQVRGWLIAGRILHDRGDHVRSLVLVDRALHTCSSEGMMLTLHRDWNWIRPLISGNQQLRTTHRDAMTSLGNPAASTAAQGPLPAIPQLPEHVSCGNLTEREGQVLDLLAQMYSTEEIAAALFVSANTVKTHLKGIFAKLSVNRRVDAVRRGRQLGLC